MLRTILIGTASALLALWAAPAASSAAASGQSAAARFANVGLQAAKNQLMLENFVVGAAGQGIPWELAKEDLQAAVAIDPALAPKYSAAISALGSLEELPDTDVTPAISDEYAQYGEVINKSIGPIPNPRTPYVVPLPGRAFHRAALAWTHEPRNPSRGVTASYLKVAAADLQSGFTIREKDSEFYPALIQDLRDLQHAPRSAVASEKFNRYRAEIGLLNDFFQLNQVSPGVVEKT